MSDTVSLPAAQEIPAASIPAVNRLAIHYHRIDGDYRDAGLWLWDGSRRHPAFQPHEVLASEEDDFGVLFEINLEKLHLTGTHARLGFIPRIHKSWSFKDGHDRYWNPRMGREIWLVEEDHRIHTHAPVVDPRVQCSFLDDWDRLLVVLSHPAPVVELSPDTIVVTRGKESLAIKEVHPRPDRNGKSRLIDVRLARRVEKIAESLTVSVNGYEPAAAMPRNVMFDAEHFGADDMPLGAIYSREATIFRQFSPPATAMKVVLYDGAEGAGGRREVSLEPIGRGFWQCRVEGDLEGRHYTLLVSTNRRENVEACDPHATNTAGPGGRARITDLRRTDPPGFRPVRRPRAIASPTDAVIYEISVRDFTISPDSGVKPEWRGKYLGFAQRGTHLPDDPAVATGIEHLRELGVTHVQLLPVQDFDNDEADPRYNWGYMTAYFNSPEGWYATDWRGAARIGELKQLVLALHEAGIGVVLDVVYNHTGEQNTFEQVAPQYFHRRRDNGTLHNGSGTGNEFRSEARMGRRFIVDSCRYWIEEYGVDGFRFDLMGLIDLETMLAVREELLRLHPQLLIYGEPWTGGEAGIERITDKGAVRGTGIAAFNDEYRNALKGAPDGDSPGYVQTGHGRDAVIRGIAGSIDDWTAHPADSINYATCHDNLTLWDKLAVSTPASEDDRVRMQMLAFGILAVSQGTLFLHGGAEFCRTKNGDDNSYQSGDDVNRIEWARKAVYRPVVEFHRGMIALRRAHPVFRLRTAEEVARRLAFHLGDLPSHEAIVFTLDGAGLKGERWKQAIVLVNPTAGELTFRLPGEGTFQLYACGERAGTRGFGRIEGELAVQARSMAVLGRG